MKIKSVRNNTAPLADDDHDRGLPHDLGVLIARRRALAWLGSASLTVLVGACGEPPGFGRAEPDVIATAADGTECVAHPTETAGPFPADGSNRAHGSLANVLARSGIVRSDMRPSLDPQHAAAGGVPLELTLVLQDVGQGCAPLAGHAIYLWHCDAIGRYSIYDLPDASYLRAVGVTDAAGQAKFMTIFPGCYPGRFPHMHFEVYPSLAAATDYQARILTSQLAMPQAACEATYKSAKEYEASIANFARSPLERDGIFANNTEKQLAAQTPTLTGSPASGYAGQVTIGIKRTGTG